MSKQRLQCPYCLHDKFIVGVTRENHRDYIIFECDECSGKFCKEFYPSKLSDKKCECNCEISGAVLEQKRRIPRI